MFLSCIAGDTSRAQAIRDSSAKSGLTSPGGNELTVAPEKIDVNPVAHDDEIRLRLQKVLEATKWFSAPSVRVEEGVVFLDGIAPSENLRKWAGDLARNTQDVVAVVNRMEVRKPSAWDFGPASSGLQTLWRDFVASLPLILFGLLILVLSFAGSVMTARGSRALLRNRIKPRLLRSVVARGAGALVFLLGVYLLLRILGLTQLALTVVGGTGLIGLIVGIAFRDITENFLSSIFLSMQHPFETGDLIEVAGVTGYVQQLNMRTTIVMTLEGNLVQIPNASVYKSNIRNYTTNANRREQFDIGIGYEDVIADAQEIARSVLANHPAVLNDPEPAVLVDSLGSSTVNLRIYFWLDGSRHSWLKVRSSVIRLVKREFQQKGISMPDEAREMLFPQGVDVRLVEGKSAAAREHAEVRPDSDREADDVSTKAEAGLYSEAGVIEEQARQSQPCEPQDNLLDNASEKASVPRRQ